MLLQKLTDMWILIVALVLLGVFSWLATKYNWFNSNKTSEESNEVKISDDVCCGMHEVCETDTLINYTSKVEYYDDEELDTFKGKSPEEYEDKDLELFESVFYTLKPQDVAGWLRSMQIREIEIPQSIKEEALLIVAERRQL